MSQFYRDKWHEIHNNAAKVIEGSWTPGEFCYWIRTVPNQLPCSSCRNHARDYIDRNPPEANKNALRWTLEFHNDVNRRLGKPEYTYEQLLRNH